MIQCILLNQEGSIIATVGQIASDTSVLKYDIPYEGKIYQYSHQHEETMFFKEKLMQ